VAVAQSSDIHLPLVLNPNSDSQEQELVYDLVIDANSTENWSKVQTAFEEEGIYLERNGTNIAIQIDDNGALRQLAEINCTGDGCSDGTADVQAAAELAPQDFEIVITLDTVRSLLLRLETATRLRIQLVNRGVVVKTSVFTCNTGTCQIRLSSIDWATPTPTRTQPTPTRTPTPTSTRVQPTPTRTPSPTPTRTPATPDHNHEDVAWHAPGAHGDRPAHEHGDPVPQWLLNAGYTPSFTHVGNTPNENHFYWKHTGFKGWAGAFQGVQWYGIFHLDFNPGGHVSRFHSYQLWLRDATGAVSHFHGWVDFGEGNNTGPNLEIVCDENFTTRPIIAVNQAGCDPIFESWYARAGGANGNALWMPDFGFNIASNYFAGGDPANPATWTPIDGADRNVNRRMEFAWYAPRSNQRGEFYATQFGDIVNGPNDPRCGTSRSYGERSYTLVCLRQYIAPTLTTIQFPGNSVQRTFPGGNVVQLPN
jgi:hypothetical protein